MPSSERRVRYGSEREFTICGYALSGDEFPVAIALACGLLRDATFQLEMINPGVEAIIEQQRGDCSAFAFNTLDYPNKPCP